jgi:hypothetical protein
MSFCYKQELIDYLPLEQREYAIGACYEFLCDTLKDFLESKFSKDKQQDLRLAKDNFDDYCRFMKEKS